MSSAFAAEPGPQGFERRRESAPSPFVLAQSGQEPADLVLLAEGELVRNAAEWLAGFVQRSLGSRLPVVAANELKTGGRYIVAAVGDTSPLIRRLSQSDKFHADPRVGPQGFVLERARDPELGEFLICWSPSELGCRYGLLEILRSLRVANGAVTTDIARVLDRPQFPIRICYVNFAEHLQNAYNPNLLFESTVNRWSPQDWERFIDMLSAFRYTTFEFWLVPTLFSPEALTGGKIQADFAATMQHVIAYAKRRGVSVHPIQAVNTVGQKWHYHCPRDPKEHAEIIALWDHWARALKGIDSIGFFPGDPGGCTRNGCTAETFVDLCLELAPVVRKSNPNLAVEVGTWGDPFAGWGVGLWTGKPDRAAQAMKYFLGKLPEFPPGTFTSINLGFSPDCTASHGGDARVYAKEAAKSRPVLTWDYSVTEGESTVSPRCRIRRIFERRREELAIGSAGASPSQCYSGGIAYTMAPRLQCLSLFACAEAYWNPAQRPENVLADYGRLIFGEDRAAIGPLLEEFEVIPDWGYYAPFPYTPQRLADSMAKLLSLLREGEAPAEPRLPLLREGEAPAEPRLPLAVPLAEYRKSLLFFADLFGKLAAVALSLDEAAALAKASGNVPANRKELLSLDEIDQLLAAPADFPQKPRLCELAARLRQLDVPALTKSYWHTVYGIYDSIPHPVDPRAQGATSGLFRHFHCDLAIPHQPSRLERALQATGKPFLLIDLGSRASERGWTLSGWTGPDEYEGETWRASFDQPGTIARDDFEDRGYRWLVVLLTEGPKGGRKTIAINGKVIGEFLRTGPPTHVRREWWMIRSFPIPEGLLRNGHIEIRFTDPGVAISAVALAADRVPDTR